MVVANDFGRLAFDGRRPFLERLESMAPGVGRAAHSGDAERSGGARILVEGFGAVEWQPGNPSGWLPLDPATVQADIQARRTYTALTRAEVVSSGAAGDTVYAGTADGNVFVSFDRGRSFRQIEQRLFRRAGGRDFRG